MNTDREPIGTVTTTQAIECSPFRAEPLPQGTYDVDHMSPWGPVVTATNDLGHMTVIAKKYVAELTFADAR